MEIEKIKNLYTKGQQIRFSKSNSKREKLRQVRRKNHK